MRTRLEGWRWFEGEGNTGYAFSGTLARLSFSQSSRRIDWQIEMAAPILLGLPRNASGPGAQGQFGLGASYSAANDGTRNSGMIFPMQSFVRLKKFLGNEPDSLRFGRFQFADGAETTPKDATLAALKTSRVNQRLIGTFAFTHVQRAFYGTHYQHDTPKLNWTVVGAFPTRGVFQADGWGLMKTAFAYASLTRPVARSNQSAEWRLFGVYYDDWRRVIKSDNRPAAVRQTDSEPVRIGTVGAHFIHTGDTKLGATDVVAWTALQFGRWGALQHRAVSFDFEAGLQPPVLRSFKPWLRAGYTFGSGDGDPGDSTHGSFFQLLPTPRLFALFPISNMMNNRDLFGIVILRPSGRLTVKQESHWLRLASGQDLWYSGGGAFQPWTFGFPGRPSNGSDALARIYDMNVDYVLNPHASMTAYWGYAFGGTVISKIYERNKNGSFGFLELNVRF